MVTTVTEAFWNSVEPAQCVVMSAYYPIRVAMATPSKNECLVPLYLWRHWSRNYRKGLTLVAIQEIF